MAFPVLSGCSESPIEPLHASEFAIKYKTIGISINNYCPRVGYHFADFWAIGFSYEIQGGKILTDFDRDGLPDILEYNTNFGISPLYADTNNDGYSDLVIYRAGLTSVEQTKLRFCADHAKATSLDVLNDCEKNFLKLDVTRWDTSGDGIPDALKVRYGLNPLDATEATLNPSGDGIPNNEKIKLNLPVGEFVTPATQAFAYQYLTQPYTDPSSGQICQTLQVSNLPFVDVSNGNLVQLYFFEKSPTGLHAMRRMPMVLEDLTPDSTGFAQVSYTQGDSSEWAVQ